MGPRRMEREHPAGRQRCPRPAAVTADSLGQESGPAPAELQLPLVFVSGMLAREKAPAQQRGQQM